MLVGVSTSAGPASKDQRKDEVIFITKSKQLFRIREAERRFIYGFFSERPLATCPAIGSCFCDRKPMIPIYQDHVVYDQRVRNLLNVIPRAQTNCFLCGWCTIAAQPQPVAQTASCPTSHWIATCRCAFISPVLYLRQTPGIPCWSFPKQSVAVYRLSLLLVL